MCGSGTPAHYASDNSEKQHPKDGMNIVRIRSLASNYRFARSLAALKPFDHFVIAQKGSSIAKGFHLPPFPLDESYVRVFIN